MDDNLSTKSSESSLTTSGEYEIVSDSNITTPIDQQHLSENGTLLIIPTNNKSPTLNLANNRNIADLQNAMTDALREIDLNSDTSSTAPKAVALSKQKSLTLPLAGTSSPALLVPDNDCEQQQLVLPKTAMKSQSLNRHHTDYAMTPKSDDASTSEQNRVGQSVFYDCIDASPGGVGGGVEEKQDIMKPEKNDTDEEVSDIDQGCTIFSGVTYLGAANINAPKSEIDIYRIMNELNSNSESVGLKISVSIPNCSDGLVVLHDAETNSVIATYEIQSIILYFRGPVETPENGCFAFTWLHGDALFQCHVFRCHIPEAVNQVSACFQKAFRTYPPSMTCSLTSAIDSNMMNSVTSDVSGNPLNTAGYEFIVSLEIREKVAKNSFSAVPRDRNCFKLRANIDKEVIITVKQTPSNILQPLFIERCFGVLLSPGKLVRQGDMQLIDMVNMSYQLPTTTAGGGNANAATIVGVGAADNAGGSGAPPLCLYPYVIRAEWKANEAAFEQLNVEASKNFLTVAVDIVVRGIRDPVRFVIETPVVIQSASEIRIMDHFISKRPMTLRFYLQLERTTDEFSWKVNSIDPSEEINEPQQPSSLLKFGMNNLSRIVRSSSIVSIEDDCPTDYSSDGDEPLLSGTGEVSKDCSQDKLDEWDPILKEWDSEKRPKNLAPLVRLGIPEALREKIWQKLANVEGKTEMLDMYKILITKETKCETVIQRDIHRTFPAHKCFKESGGSGQDSLFKVSKAYAVYDSEVGYCQGLSFIAASLLLHMPEEDAFCVLVALMYDYGLRDLYKQGFEVLYLRLYQLDRLIKDQLPKLHEHFAACGIETHMYASQWFLTLFTARFPLCFVFHVLDVFLLDGVPLLFQVAVTLLSICEADLRQLDFEGILKYFRVTLPKKCRSPSQARRVMKMACERKIKKLKQYEEEFQLKKQHKERLEKEAQIYENRFGEERRKLQAEIDELQKKLIEANERAIEKERKHTGIIQDYKLIIQRLENDITNLNETLGNVMNIVSKCKNCVQKMENADRSVRLPAEVSRNSGLKTTQQSCNKQENEAPLGPLDPINIATQRIRELELELAQAKLAHVEAECRNQDLNHQLSATITEMHSNRNSWQPWLSKTLNSLQEKVTTRGSRDTVLPTFQSYTQHASAGASAAGSETNSPSSNQEFKAFSVGGSPKLPAKFQTVKLRNSIDSLRNIVVPLESSAGRIVGIGATATVDVGVGAADQFRQHLQPQSSLI
ncbi:rab GTPase-activating protein 1-like isoform X1 [Bactrocera neohumeralis]|uniref:rab GTPase-activating protein 1-like isoform X1 n=1 Tax=Bactrocera neohumeralis TaxID=98809 RepID=UPI0021668E50|nr:rab GTPase-activating protein 1-like isoform X1 [Bactrocera neohumeralis]XP_050337134.1 rab GTPase-activating protein 1-like isoform X1 [Bactrocera neohumeralis]XP_050337135.1 rab GTPase-activating protein 1-like isoform X1 [Bactrocera neohumeralis]XP_050337136.1 rab GTPase-activating protein 1-like isoform X1 [Bactrocera neohumeralis]